MGEKHNKLTTIKLTPENLRGVRERVKVHKASGLNVTLVATANEIMAAGLKALEPVPKSSIIPAHSDPNA